MKSYYSLIFGLFFLPVTVIVYQLFPPKKRWIVLLGASYLFFWSISQQLIVYILFSSLSIHHFGLWMESIDNEFKLKKPYLDKAVLKSERQAMMQKKRYVLLMAISLHLGLLIALKYSAFFIRNMNIAFDFFRFPLWIEVPSFLLPIGISFYSLQAISYMCDVYRGTITADRNLGRLALYLTFFPQLMEGPICRYGEMASQLWQGKSVTYGQLTFGMQRILLGLMKKMVIADRLNPLVDEIFKNYQTYSGEIIFVGAVAYTAQLYMEFSGTMDLVIGTAEIFGIRLPENFRQPFFSRSIAEFWRRWHITLGAWFKDYVFYPVSMSQFSKKLTRKARKKAGNYFGPLLAGGIALLAVWIANGFWHGVGWNYLFFGLYHFVLIFTGSLMIPFFKKIHTTFNIDAHHYAYQAMQMIRTVLLVCVGELFFRADGLYAGMQMFKKMVTAFSLTGLQDGTLLNLGLDRHDFMIVLLAGAMMLIIGILKEKNIEIRKALAVRPLPVRWLVYYMLIMAIVVFGAYGSGYIPVNPMYANF